jgi:hypothetical protein
MMVIMGSSRLNNQTLYDEIRKQWVVAHPEEVVRQTLVQHMIRQLRFPKELICIEKSLREISLKAHLAPDRRADVVAFGKNTQIDSILSPLLLIECKAEACTKDAFDQLMGYNHFVQAPFGALVGKSEMVVAFCKEGVVQTFLPTLPSYDQLLSIL